MPLTTKIWSFTKGMVSIDKDDFGIYELLDGSDNVLYIGQGQVKTRLMAHFPDGSDPIVGASKYRIEYTGSKEKAEQREKQELDSYYKSHRQYPKFNQRRG